MEKSPLGAGIVNTGTAHGKEADIKKTRNISNSITYNLSEHLRDKMYKRMEWVKWIAKSRDKS